MVHIHAVGLDPTVWEDPLSFKPDRFVGDDAYPSCILSSSPFKLYLSSLIYDLKKIDLT
jgi:cytochrome P450